MKGLRLVALACLTTALLASCSCKNTSEMSKATSETSKDASETSKYASEISKDTSETSKAKEKEQSAETEKAAAESLALDVAEYKAMPESLRKLRRAAIILAEYTTLKGNQYTLDISKEEAIAKGVTVAEYDNIKANLAATNKAILQAIKNGDTLILHDVKAEAKAHKGTE